MIEQLAELPVGLADDVVGLAQQASDDLVLILVHEGGAKGKALLDRLRKAAVEVVEAPLSRRGSCRSSWWPRCASAAVASIAKPPRRSWGAVGSDLRSVAAAVARLLADTEQPVITTADVHRYFAGRAEVSGFAIADHCLDGNRAAALGSLRWALGNRGRAPVLLTSAVASGLRSLGAYAGGLP